MLVFSPDEIKTPLQIIVFVAEQVKYREREMSRKNNKLEPTKEQLKFSSTYLKSILLKIDKITNDVRKKMTMTMKSRSKVKSKSKSSLTSLSVANKEKQCRNTYIKSHTDKLDKQRQAWQAFLKEEYKNLETVKSKVTSDQFKYIKSVFKTLLAPKDKKVEKFFQEASQRLSCNVGCRGTLLEPGPANELPHDFMNLPLYKRNPNLLKTSKEHRKTLFGTKTNVLDSDSFYEKIKPARKRELMNQGAISNCSEF